MICLDTNVLIAMMRGDKDVRSVIESDDWEDLAVTPVTLCELYRGAHLYSRPNEELERIENALSDIEIIEFVPDACKRFGKIYADLRRLGRIPQEPDLMIASICLSHGISLATRNGDDFKDIPGLKVVVL